MARLIEQKGTVSVTELSRMFDVAEETVRRDLKRLEEQGILRRIHGGAVNLSQDLLAGGKNHGVLPFLARSEINRKLKELIAERAASLIEDMDTIFLDSGTTTTALAKKLKDRKNLVVLTNSLTAALELAGNSSITVTLTGGTVRSPEFSLIGPDAVASIAKTRVDKAFLAAAGVSQDHGLSVSNQFEAEVKAAAMKVARQKILLVDSSKFQTSAMISYAPIDALTAVITDSLAPPTQVGQLRALGIKVELVENSKACTGGN